LEESKFKYDGEKLKAS